MFNSKSSKWLQWNMYIWCKYTVKFSICTKSMELLELYSKEEANICCSIKFLFIKIRCLMSHEEHKNGENMADPH